MKFYEMLDGLNEAFAKEILPIVLVYCRLFVELLVHQVIYYFKSKCGHFESSFQKFTDTLL